MYKNGTRGLLLDQTLLQQWRLYTLVILHPMSYDRLAPCW